MISLVGCGTHPDGGCDVVVVGPGTIPCLGFVLFGLIKPGKSLAGLAPRSGQKGPTGPIEKMTNGTPNFRKARARSAMPQEWQERFARARSMALKAGILVKELAPRVHECFATLTINTLARIIKGQRRSRHYADIVRALAYVISLAEGSESDAEHQRELVSKIIGIREDAGLKASDPLPRLPPEMFLLLPEYPHDLKRQFRRGVKLSMFGTNLRRHRNHQKAIEHLLQKRGSHIDVILCDPDSSAASFAAFQETGLHSPSSVARFIREVRKTYRWLCDLKTRNNNRYYDKIDIYKIDYALTFGFDALEFPDGAGIIYLRVYPLMSKEGEGDRPIIGIESGRAIWYSFFQIQWERHLAHAKPWPCPKRSRKTRR